MQRSHSPLPSRASRSAAEIVSLTLPPGAHALSRRDTGLSGFFHPRGNRRVASGAISAAVPVSPLPDAGKASTATMQIDLGTNGCYTIPSTGNQSPETPRYCRKRASLPSCHGVKKSHLPHAFCFASWRYFLFPYRFHRKPAISLSKVNIGCRRFRRRCTGTHRGTSHHKRSRGARCKTARSARTRKFCRCEW